MAIAYKGIFFAYAPDANNDFVVFANVDFILMSSRLDWHFWTMRPQSDAPRRVLKQNLQCTTDRIDLLPITTRNLSATAQHLEMEGEEPQSFVMTTLNLPERQWMIVSLPPATPATLSALRTLLNAGLSLLLILVGLLKQARQVERLAQQEWARCLRLCHMN